MQKVNSKKKSTVKVKVKVNGQRCSQLLVMTSARDYVDADVAVMTLVGDPATREACGSIFAEALDCVCGRVDSLMRLILY